MLEASNEFESTASNGCGHRKAHTQRTERMSSRGEVIMNSIQKATAAVIALVITLVGGTLATAPLALADVQHVAFHQSVSVSSGESPSLRHG